MRLPLGLPFLVVIPPFGIATRDVYRAWDELGGPRRTGSVPPPRALEPVIARLSNDLEPAAEAVEPRLVEFREAVEEVAGRPAVLAGSGSSYVVPVDVDGRRAGRARVAARGAAAATGHRRRDRLTGCVAL